MELNGFMIVPNIKELFKIKVGTLIAEHPVVISMTKPPLKRILLLVVFCVYFPENGDKVGYDDCLINCGFSFALHIWKERISKH